MNKQFLSLLLLTSFVGTMSPSAGVTALSTVVKPTGLSIWAPNFILVGAKSFGAKAASFMSATGSKIAGFMGRVPANNATVFGLGVAGAGAATFAAASTDLVHNVVKSTGNYMHQAQEFAMPFLGTPVRDARIAAELAARPWYTRAGSAVAGYASAAKVSASKGVKAVVASVKLHPKSAIAAGVVGTAAVSYLAYRLYNGSSSSSISLNEQERANLRVALRRADTFGKEVFHNPSVTTPVRLEEVFATESTGLPKKAVDVLNKHVALSRKLSDIAAIQTTRVLSPYDLAIQKELKDLDAQLLATLPIAAAAA